MTSQPLRRASYGAIALLSLAVAGYALVTYTMFPLGAAVHPDMRATFETHRGAIHGHVFGAAVSLLLGPFQFSRRLRSARPALHRLCGRIYLLAGVGIGGLSGLYMAAYAYGGTVSSLGFGLLALAWLYTGMRAYSAARDKDFVRHRAWMVRNFALAFAAVTLRLYLGIAFATGVPFEVAYPLLAWVSWVPNLILAEVLVRKDTGPSAT